MSVTPEEVTKARGDLETAIKTWLKVKAQEEEGDFEYETDDPILQDWIVIVGYTSVRLEQDQITAAAYECGDSQAAYASRGLALSGVDRWKFRGGH